MAFHDVSAPAQHHLSTDASRFGANAAPSEMRIPVNDASVSVLSACPSSSTPPFPSRTVPAGTRQELSQQRLEPSHHEHRSLVEQPGTVSSFPPNIAGACGSLAAISGNSYAHPSGVTEAVVTGPVPIRVPERATDRDGGKGMPNMTAGNVSTPSQNGGAPGGGLAHFYMQLPLDEKKYVSEQARDEAFRRLRRENRTCFDCASRNPTWLSTTYGVYLCLTCSGKHRRLGTHISFVRSCEMDKFTPEQLLRMELGGNKRAHEFFREHGLDAARTVDYYGKLAARYKQQLDKLVSQEMNAAGWRPSGSSAAIAHSSSTESRAATLQQQQQNSTQQQCIQQQQAIQQPNLQQQNLQQQPLLLGAGFGFVPVGSASLPTAVASGQDVLSSSSSSNTTGSLSHHGNNDIFFSPPAGALSGNLAAPTTPSPLSLASSGGISSLPSHSKTATTSLSGGEKVLAKAGGTASTTPGLLSQSNAGIATAPPPAAGTLRARKLDLDFDFEKEIAASNRATADHHLLIQHEDVTPLGGLGQQQRTGTATGAAAPAKLSVVDSDNVGAQTGLNSSVDLFGCTYTRLNVLDNQTKCTMKKTTLVDIRVYMCGKYEEDFNQKALPRMEKGVPSSTFFDETGDMYVIDDL